jgi:serine/threonine-protein kinase
MAASQRIAPGYLIAERYRVVRHIGEGGMGNVYLVQHVKTDERFALKILNPSVAATHTARERFRREARTPARIDSDHVARVVDSDIAADLGDAPFLVMEYLRGQNLQDLSDSLGALEPREVLVYLRQIAIALDKAHHLGIVHRDLKPENLFLTTRDDGSPCVKVLDFGIAKLSGATGDLAKVKATATGDIFGTPLYMSPEQCKSESERVSSQTDIWALGLIAHRLLTGQEFWTANTLTHLIAQIAYEPMPLARDRGAVYGEAYDAWFAKCCAREVEQRFVSAGEAVAALQQALGLESEATGQVMQELVAAEVAKRALLSTPGTSSPGFSKTSEAITLEKIDTVVVPTKSRAPLVAAALLGAAALVGVGLYVATNSSASAPSAEPAALAAPAAATETSIESATGPTPSAEPVGAPSATVDPATSAEPQTMPTPPTPPALPPLGATAPPFTPPSATPSPAKPPALTVQPPTKPPAPPAAPQPTVNPLDRRH